MCVSTIFLTPLFYLKFASTVTVITIIIGTRMLIVKYYLNNTIHLLFRGDFFVLQFKCVCRRVNNNLLFKEKNSLRKKTKLSQLLLLVLMLIVKYYLNNAIHLLFRGDFSVLQFKCVC